MKKLGMLIGIALLSFAFVNVAEAGQVVDQGTRPWKIDGTVTVTGAASGASTDVCVTVAAAAAIPTSALTGRRMCEVQNNGPNPINCTVDADTLTTAAPMAHVIPGGINASWSLPCTAALPIRCIAMVADQAAATGCTNIHEIK